MSDQDEVSLELAAPAPAPPGGGPKVVIAESVVEAVNRHARDEIQHEIGGVLVGTVFDGPEPCVIVEDIIVGTEMRHSGASVTFTHETWDQINAEKDSRFADKRIVGWYHSHPGFGIFLSGHDLFIHQNFFSAPWQVAIVTDPKAGTWGCFTWNNGSLHQEPGYLLYRLMPAPDTEPDVAPPATAPPVVPVPSTPPLPALASTTWALGLLAVLIAGVLALSLANFAQLARFNKQVADQFSVLQAQIGELKADLPQTAAAPAADSAVPEAHAAAPKASPASPERSAPGTGEPTAPEVTPDGRSTPGR